MSYSPYLIEQSHHLHKGRRVSLLSSYALYLRFNPLQEIVQFLQCVGDLVWQVLGESPHPFSRVRRQYLFDWLEIDTQPANIVEIL